MIEELKSSSRINEIIETHEFFSGDLLVSLDLDGLGEELPDREIP